MICSSGNGGRKAFSVPLLCYGRVTHQCPDTCIYDVFQDCRSAVWSPKGCGEHAAARHQDCTSSARRRGSWMARDLTRLHENGNQSQLLAEGGLSMRRSSHG